MWLFNMLRRRGNPNWGKAALSTHPHIATQFENEVRRLGLTKDTCVASVELRSWCERNRNQLYVPGYGKAQGGPGAAVQKPVWPHILKQDAAPRNLRAGPTRACVPDALSTPKTST